MPGKRWGFDLKFHRSMSDVEGQIQRSGYWDCRRVASSDEEWEKTLRFAIANQKAAWVRSTIAHQSWDSLGGG